jgi:hypothetical protein
MTGPEHLQISLWGVDHDSPSSGGVEAYSPPDPASTLNRGSDRVEPNSQGPFFVGLDTGEKENKTVACWRDELGTEQYRYFSDPTEAVSHSTWPPGARIVFENSVWGHTLSRRPAFDAAMRDRGLVPYPISPRHTKNRRRSWFPQETKTRQQQNDELDALVLLRIGEEGVVKHTLNVWRRSLTKAEDSIAGADRLPREPHEVLLINLRRHGVDHHSVPQALRDVLRATLEFRPVPIFAIDAGLASRVGGIGKWDTAGYRLTTMLVVAIEARSKGHAKKILRKRGLARANLMHHPLKNQKSRRARKAVMKAQDQLVRWLMDNVVAKYRAESRQLRVVKEAS